MEVVVKLLRKAVFREMFSEGSFRMFANQFTIPSRRVALCALHTHTLLAALACLPACLLRRAVSSRSPQCGAAGPFPPAGWLAGGLADWAGYGWLAGWLPFAPARASASLPPRPRSLAEPPERKGRSSSSGSGGAGGGEKGKEKRMHTHTHT